MTTLNPNEPAPDLDPDGHFGVEGEVWEDETGVGAIGLKAPAGWVTPSESLYEFLPEITVTRGGISFTRGPDLDALLAKLTKPQLRARLASVEKALRKERKRRYRAERKNQRLLKIIGRLT